MSLNWSYFRRKNHPELEEKGGRERIRKSGLDKADIIRMEKIAQNRSQDNLSCFDCEAK